MKIIGYNPADHMKMESINMAMGGPAHMINEIAGSLKKRMYDEKNQQIQMAKYWESLK